MMFQVLILDQNSLIKLKKYNVAKVFHHMQGTLVLCKKIQIIKMFY